MLLDRDGGGQLAALLTADAEALEQARAAGATPLADLVATGRTLAVEGWRTTSSTAEDGARTVRMETDFADPDGLSELTTDLSGALLGEEGRLVSPFAATVTPETIELTGAAALQPTDEALTSLGLDRPTALAILRESFVSQVLVTMPGPVQRADGARIDELTATYVVTPGEAVTIDVSATRPPRFSVLEMVLAGLVAVLLGGLVALGLRRRGPLWAGQGGAESEEAGAPETSGPGPVATTRRRRSTRPGADPDAGGSAG